MLAGFFAGCAPAWIHNYFIAHDPVLLSAHGGLNFWMGNNPDATGYPKVPPGLRTDQDGLLRDSITWAEKAAGHPLKRSEVSRYWSAQAHRYIAEHPAEWLALLGRKLRNFWNAFQYDDLSVITLLDDRGVLLPGLRWGLVAALGLAGLLVAGAAQRARALGGGGGAAPHAGDHAGLHHRAVSAGGSAGPDRARDVRAGAPLEGAGGARVGLRRRVYRHWRRARRFSSRGRCTIRRSGRSILTMWG